jgi:phosphatidate cytidylyltransferase
VNKDLAIRLASSLVLIPITASLIVMGGWFFGLLLLLGLIPALYEWFKLCENTPRQYLLMSAGVVYIALTFGSYIFLRFGFEQGAWLSLVVIFCVWASDIGAYFTGKTIGGPKLAPRISPKKTWAGFAGACFFSGLLMIILLGVSPFINDFIPTDLGITSNQVWLVFIFGALCGAVGQVGDLSISVLKRRKGSKDAGSLIPGHGGILDRIDSLMLVSLFFTVIVALWL